MTDRAGWFTLQLDDEPDDDGEWVLWLVELGGAKKAAGYVYAGYVERVRSYLNER